MKSKGLQEKFDNWFMKAKEGNKDFCLITKDTEGQYYCVNNQMLEKVHSMLIAACKNNQFRIFFEWDAQSEKENKQELALVMKDDKKMILNDKLEGVISFGFPDNDDSIEKMIILLKTEGVNTIITAAKEASTIEVTYSVQHSKEDILHICFKELLHSLTEQEIDESEAKEIAVSNQ